LSTHFDSHTASETGLFFLSGTSRQGLLAWFQKEKRDLAWRHDRTAYRVWVSEIMLQQTQVATVIPYYDRFLEALPDVRALAAAPQDQLMALWAGLGYYSRARRLQECAKRLVQDFDGEFPRDPEVMASLPGFGPYTVAAVGSLAFGLDLAVLDGNVQRVLARLSCFEDCVDKAAGKKSLQVIADALLWPGRAGEWNEALMELGARLCSPYAPRCLECPLAESCLAMKAGCAEGLPVKSKKKARAIRQVAVAVLEDGEGRILVRRRPDGGLLSGLWELPNTVRQGSCATGLSESQRDDFESEGDQELEGGAPLLAFKHEYSHFTAQIQSCVYRVEESAAWPEAADQRWLDADAHEGLGFSSSDRKLLRAYSKKYRI
jgi:A/G-specific adenine glycosylase